MKRRRRASRSYKRTKQNWSTSHHGKKAPARRRNSRRKPAAIHRNSALVPVFPTFSDRLSPLFSLSRSLILVAIVCLLGLVSFLWAMTEREDEQSTVATSHVSESAKNSSTSTTSIEVTEETEPSSQPFVKSQEAKDATMQADLATMDNFGLHYDYAHLSLVDTVLAYLADQGLDASQVAFSYKNIETGETFSLNDGQLMTAGSTYKLPLNMLVVDAIAAGQVSATEAYDITNTPYEYKPEHDAYVANYGGKMTIADMQYGSIVVSENTPAYALAERLGGMEAAFSLFNRYGKSRTSEIEAFAIEGNKTTTDYYIQVLEYLYYHQDKYADLLYYLDEAFPGDWYEEYNYGVTIYQKPGYVREALNVDAIVIEETPYLIALYSAGFGGASAEDEEFSGYGYYQLTALTYVINEWHRVNMNPGPTPEETDTATSTAME